MSPAPRVVVIGAGIAGLAHAWSAAERGWQVTVLERDPRAVGASIRNFGMVWPIGQPPGPLRETALAARRRWLQLAEEAEIWVNRCGSLHLAHREDEEAVLREFLERSEGPEFQLKWLSPEEVLRHAPAAEAKGLRGGLFSDAELGVDPRQAIRELPAWLVKRFGVQFEFQTGIVEIDGGRLTANNGRHWEAERVIVCSGAELAGLFPDLIRQSGLVRCKLQMLKTPPQPDGWRTGPHLAGGLTLRHYKAFEGCPSLPEVRQRIAREMPELDRFGIHVMASQNERGEVLLGDSHEYDEQIEPFDKVEIDELMLRELRKIIRLPDWTIAERWHGIYAKHPTDPWFQAEPQPGVHVGTGLGGAGMTMSFGLAEQFWQRPPAGKQAG